MSRRILLVLAVVVALGALMTFGNAVKADAQALKGSPNEEYIAVTCMGNLEYFSAHKFAWKWMGDQLRVKTSYIGPAEYDVPGEIAAFDQAIARKPAGIVCFGVDESLKPSIDKAVAAGIPVATISGDVNLDGVTDVADLGVNWTQAAFAVIGGVGQAIFAGGDGWVYSFRVNPAAGAGESRLAGGLRPPFGCGPRASDRTSIVPRGREGWEGFEGCEGSERQEAGRAGIHGVRQDFLATVM